MKTDIDINDYSTKDVVTPSNGLFNIRIGYWWWCEDGDPTKAVFYKGHAPQCNPDRKILEHYEKPYDGCELVKIPVSYTRFNNR